MINTETIKKELVAAIPEDILRERAEMNDLLSTLKMRRDGYEKTLRDKAEEVERAERELSRAVSSGQDGAKALARIEALQRESEGIKRLMGMTDDEIDKAGDLLVETKKKISEALSKVVMEKRLIVAAELASEIVKIEDTLEEWRAATAQAADALGCDLQAGTDVIIKSRILLHHLN